MNVAPPGPNNSLCVGEQRKDEGLPGRLVAWPEGATLRGPGGTSLEGVVLQGW